MVIEKHNATKNTALTRAPEKIVLIYKKDWYVIVLSIDVYFYPTLKWIGQLIVNIPKTSALAQPYVFLSHDFGAIFTDTKAIIKAAISESMWKLSAINAMLLVRWPTTSSTTKYVVVRPNIDNKRHRFPVYLPIVNYYLWHWWNKSTLLAKYL